MSTVTTILVLVSIISIVFNVFLVWETKRLKDKCNVLSGQRLTRKGISPLPNININVEKLVSSPVINVSGEHDRDRMLKEIREALIKTINEYQVYMYHENRV